MADDFDFSGLDAFNFGEYDTLETGYKPAQQPDKTPAMSDVVTSLRRRAMLVIFIVDVSGSMKGARIGAVNDAIRNVLPELRRKERSSTAAEIKIAVMEFSGAAKWRTPEPVPVADFLYEDIQNLGGGTNYGAAFYALNEKLTRSKFLNAAAGAYTPLIIFMTDGKPSDMGLYKEELNKLMNNRWFTHSTRAGIAIEEGALSPECIAVLTEFTGNPSNVYEAKDTVMLARQIELVTMTGVDFVTKQGSIQNTSAAPAEKSAAFSSVKDKNDPPLTAASPTIPALPADWESGFDV